MSNNGKRYTSVGTDIEEVKRQNAQAGNGKSAALGTSAFATDPQKVKAEIAQEAGPFPSGNQPSLGKTAAGTNIAEVKRQNAQAENGKSAALGTSAFGTDPQKVKAEIASEAGPFPSGNQPSLGKTVVGTDIAEVKRLNAQSGLSYSEVLNALGTNPQKVKEEIAREAGPFPSSNSARAGKTVVGTDIAEVKRHNTQSSKKS